MPAVDLFISASQHKKLRYALLTNHACLASSGVPVALELVRNGFNIRKIFSPEHGVYSQAEDGLRQRDERDLLTGLPVASLYGDRFKPSRTDLHDIDAVIADLPNTGCRFYTYLWTLTYVLDACAEFQKPLIILDRANQNLRSQFYAEGPLLEESTTASFLGRWKMPVTFGLSLGDLMKWFVHDRQIDVQLKVVKDPVPAFFTVPPSPSIPDQETVDLYPGVCLLEGVNVSVGRGTSFPFRVVGAPWINPEEIFEDVKAMQIPGLACYPYAFKPMWSNYSGQFCYGLLFRLINRQDFRPVHFGITLIHYLATKYQTYFTPERYPTAANPEGESHLDRLLGVPDAFQIITARQFDRQTFTSSDELKVWVADVKTFLTDN